MKTSHAVLAAGLCIAGLAGYGFLQADADNSVEVAAAAPADLQARLLALQEELDRLRGHVADNHDTAQQALASAMQNDRAIERLKQAPLAAVVAAAPQAAGAKDETTGTALGGVGAATAQSPELVRGVAMPTAVDTTSPAFQGAIRESLDAIRKQEQEERRVERDQRRQERLTARLDKMTQRLNLLPAQRGRIVEIYAESQAQRQLLFDRVRSGEASRDEIRQEVRGIRKAQAQAITDLLDPQQQAEYTKMQEEEQAARGGRRGRNGKSRRSGRGGAGAL